MSSAFDNDRTYLLGEPTFKKLPNGRLKCVETGHEISARDKESYSKGKRCRLELINSAVANRKPPFNMFAQDPDSRSNLICKLTGDSISKSEEQIWKHMNGRRFLDKLEEQERTKRKANDRFEDDPARKKLKNKNNKKGKGKEKMIDDSDSEAIETSKKKRKSGMDFWFPPKGNRRGFDDGRNRSVSASEPKSESEEDVEEGSDNDSWSSEEIPTKKKRKFIADRSSSRKKKNNIDDFARGSEEEDRGRKSKGFTFPGHAWTESCDAPRELPLDHDEPVELPKLPFLIPEDSEDNKDMNHGVYEGDMNHGVYEGDMNHGVQDGDMNNGVHDDRMNHETHNRDMYQEIPVPNSPSSKDPVEVSCGSFTFQSVVRAITHILKENFMGPYETWKLVPLDIRKFYWRKFQEKFLVKEENYNEIKKVWELTSQRRYISMLCEARREALRKTGRKNISETKGKGPAWMKPAIWNAIVDKWDTPKWKGISQSARKNRMTEKDGCITKHSGGSMTFAQHKQRLANELGREPTQAELFQRVHKGKGTDFIDNKSKRVMEAYQAALVEKYGPEGAMEVTFDEEAWTKAVGVPKKGKWVYGYGTPHLELHKRSDSSYSRSEGSSRSIEIKSEQVEEVLKANEELRIKIEEQKKEMEQQKMQMEERMEQQKMQMEQQQSQIEMMHDKMVALMAELDDGRRVLRPR